MATSSPEVGDDIPNEQIERVLRSLMPTTDLNNEKCGSE